MFIYLNKKGQSTLEYAVVIAIVVAGLIAMQTYVKRGLQGRLRQASDDIGDQFSPGYTTYDYSSTTVSGSEEKTIGSVEGEETAQQKTTTTSTQEVSRTGRETGAAFDQEYWAK